jgi:hypothetical protein
MGGNKRNYGKDSHFYAKVEVSSSTFLDESDVFITFSTNTVILTFEESADSVGYSFNGNVLHRNFGFKYINKTNDI